MKGMAMDKDFLKIAVEQAKESAKQGGFPAGAVIVKGGEVIAKGLSLGSMLNDPTQHAETDAIRKACKTLETTDLSDCVLYDSLEPCMMCFNASNWAKIPKIVFGCKRTKDMIGKDYYEGKSDIFEVNQLNNHTIDLVFTTGYEEEKNSFDQTIQSYMGLLSHCRREEIKREIEKIIHS